MDWIVAFLALGIFAIFYMGKGDNVNEIAKDLGKKAAKFTEVAGKFTEGFRAEKEAIKEVKNTITEPIEEVKTALKE